MRSENGPDPIERDSGEIYTGIVVWGDKKAASRCLVAFGSGHSLGSAAVFPVLDVGTQTRLDEDMWR
jgi:hypothetical protein